MTVGTPLYVVIAVASIVLGVLGSFTIGAPFLLSGVAMLAVLPWRRRADVLWPVLVTPWVFTIVYVLLAPLSCTTTASIGPLIARTECSNVLGIDYSGAGEYRAPLLPAVVAGLAVAASVALVLHRLLARRRSRV